MPNVNKPSSQPAQVPAAKPAKAAVKAAGEVAIGALAGAAAAVAGGAAKAASGIKDSVKTSAQGAASAAVGFVDEANEKAQSQASIEKLKKMPTAELKRLGAQKNKQAFFNALLPAALESERKYGVPAEVILAQAALESGWGKHAIGGYNIFGIKGSGPAGSVKLATTEGNGRASRASFAKFNNFHEAIVEHGQMFHNGAYDKGMKAYAKDKDPMKFVDNIAKAYATDPSYASDIKAMIRRHGLKELAAAQR